MQKGIDIIADVFFAILNDNPKTQLICVGPVIDLYGKFAALKLEKLMTRFPGRVFSRPEFTALPPCIFSGAEFALIPSRDEPFGLVAVEFGRKGALGVGSKVGGLGQMPGWWYTVESLTSQHLIHQFKQAIRTALASSQETRAKMRARALVQRFPVQQWVEDLDKLHSRSIRVSRHQRDRGSRITSSLLSFSLSTSGHSTPRSTSRPQTPVQDRIGRAIGPPVSSLSLAPLDSTLEPPPHIGNYPTLPGHTDGPDSVPEMAQPMPFPEPRAWFRSSRTSSQLSRLIVPESSSNGNDDNEGATRPLQASLENSPYSSVPSSAPSTPPGDNSWDFPFQRSDRDSNGSSGSPSTPHMLQFDSQNERRTEEAVRKAKNRFSYNSVVDNKKDFELQKVDVHFTDSQNEFYDKFSKQLNKMDVKSSEGRLCIEEFLTKSEKAWFGRFHRAKLGMDPENAPPTTIPGVFRSMQRWMKKRFHGSRETRDSFTTDNSETRPTAADPAKDGEFLLGDQYEPPTGVKKILQKKIGDWQLYSFLLAFVSSLLPSSRRIHSNSPKGQIIAANSYQITLLTGEYGKAADKLYVIAAIYIVATVIWWCLFRRIKALYVVSLPFALYGLAFFILGMSLYAPKKEAAEWIFNTATGLYAVASASGSLYFVLNFGTEGRQCARIKTYSAKSFNRWHTRPHLGIQSMCHSRHSTDLRGLSVVLGRYNKSNLWQRRTTSFEPSHDCRYRSDCGFDVDCGNHPVLGSTKLLSSTSWESPFILSISLSKENSCGES